MGTTRQKNSCRNRLQNGPHSLSRVKAGTHSPSPTGSHTAAYTPKQVAFWVGALSLPSDCFTRCGNPAWPGGRTANFAPFGSWSEALLKDTESLRNSDALMRVAVPRRRGPAGLRNLFSFLSKLRLVHTRLSEKNRTQGHTRRNRWRFGWGAIITLDTSCTFTNIPGPGVRTANFAAFGSWSGGALEERREPAEQRCAYVRRCSKASRPRWAA